MKILRIFIINWGFLLMTKVMTKAEKLADAIVESDEFVAMVKAEEKIDSDQDASELVEKIEDLQKKIDKNSENEKLKKKMSSMQRDMWDNNKIKSFMQKQQKFNKLMSKVHKRINQKLSPKASENKPK